MIRFSRRPKGDLPSTTGLLLLFLFTMAFPALFLLFVSLDLVRDEEFLLEGKSSIDRIAEGFESTLRESLDERIATYLAMDWSRFVDSPQALMAQLAPESAAVSLFGPEGDLLFPLFPPPPLGSASRSYQATPVGWRKALDDIRSLRESGQTEKALEELEDLQRLPLHAKQRAEVLLVEAEILAASRENQQAWDRIDLLIQQFPEIRSEAGVPLALIALENRMEWFKETQSKAAVQLAQALFLGCFYPDEPTERFFWDRLDAYQGQIETTDWKQIQVWKEIRNRRRRTSAQIREEFPRLAALVPDEGDSHLRIEPAEPVGSGSLEVELAHRVRVDEVPLVIVWQLDPEILSEAINRAMTEVIRFNASAYLTVEAPSGRKWISESSPAPVVRTLSLKSPWDGWDLRIGLGLQEQAARAREGAAGVVVIASLVLLIGTLLVFRGVRRQIQATRAKSDFISAVSHELRTPVANIRLYGEMLEMGVPGSEEDLREAYRTITSETERLSRLIEGVLNYSRIQQGKKVFHPEPIDLIPLVERVVARVRESVGEPFGFHVTVQGTPTTATIDVDAFSQALENLLSNAVKYSSDRREAEVIVRFGERRTEVTVRDYGIGIARKDRKRIFERFHRVEDEMTRKTGGTGLGLTLARDLVRGFGGDIKVRSRLGEGSRFTIVLPREKLRGKENADDTVTGSRG